MKPIPFLVVFFLLVVSMRAQDQLFKLDNTKLLVKVTEVSPDEIKYKLFDNLNGPQYVLKRVEVAMIIYENGSHEVIIKKSEPKYTYIESDPDTKRSERQRFDSATYFKYSRNLSLNFLNFLNSEIGFVYQKEFYKTNFSLIIPFSIGIGNPSLTQTVYFQNNNYYYSGTYNTLTLNRKLFEVGLGGNYYPSLKNVVNYYIGPVFKYMQYDATQNYSNFQNNGTNPMQVNLSTTMNRYTFSITNGIVIRTKSRLTMNTFISLGYKHDEVTEKVIDPINQKEVDPITNPNEFYFWSGIMVGLSF